MREQSDMCHPWLFEVQHHISQALRVDSPSLSTVISYFLKGQGKSVRPLLALWSGAVTGANQDSITRVAAALELVHMASLVHDDIVDCSTTRRGQKTVHRRWNEGQAVLLGDFFFAAMLRLLAPFPDMIPHMADAIHHLVLGEFKQIDQRDLLRLSEEAYLDRIYHKSAYFMAASCRMGAMAGTPDSSTLQMLDRFGFYIGTAYQLQDDLLDLTGSPNGGKPVMQDLEAGHLSLAILHAYERVSDQKSRFEQAIREKSTLKLRSYLVQCDSLTYTRQQIDHFLEKGVNVIDPLPESLEKKGLLAIVDVLRERTLKEVLLS